MKVPVDKAKRIAEELGSDAVIVISFKGKQYGTTSYGRDRETCRAFSKVCDQIHDEIGYGLIEIPEVYPR